VSEPFDARFAQVNELVLADRLPEALDILDRLADEADVTGDRVTQARARRLGAAVARIHGDLAGAVLRGEAAVAVVDADPATAVSARIELGEARLLSGDAVGAARGWEEVLAGPLDAATRASLLRKLAPLFADETGRALRLLAEAQQLVGDSPRVAVETAGLAAAAEDPTASALAERARESAAEDPVALADLDLLAAARALTAGDAEAALEACRAARRHALEAVAPLQYLGAAFAISRIADSRGRRVEAYESLAVGWVTLADLLGAEASGSVFGPELERLRDAWGAAEFASVRSAYEARRRELVCSTDGSPQKQGSCVRLLPDERTSGAIITPSDPG
jgi:hypothetical protein